jgi:hypothetical protein
MVSINCYMFQHSEGNQYLDWRVGLVFSCLNRLTAGDVPDMKHVAVDTANSARLLECLAFTFPSCRKWSPCTFLFIDRQSLPARGLLCLKMPRLYLSVLLMRQKLEIVVVM